MRVELIVLIILPFVSSKFENENIWNSSFIEAVPCEANPIVGGWCEWSEWGRCDFSTCTRKRVRTCACPSPENLTGGLCPTDLPQDDIRVSDSITTHSRFVRMTEKGKCKIPFFYNNRYYDDCAEIDGEEKCPVGAEAKLEVCLPEKGDLEERDIGACGGWKLAQGWAQTKVPEKYILEIRAISELGKQCYNPKIYTLGAGMLNPCVERYYFSKSGQRNTYSNLNNMAFNLENCKFACAIDPECQAIEFSEGYFCKLFLKFNSDNLKREIVGLGQLQLWRLQLTSLKTTVLHLYQARQV
nr:phd finger protein 10 [Hymenolepis microstoma]